MSLLFLGNTAFTDLGFPAQGKNAWGVDTLSRKLKGPVTGLAAFIAGLAQGQAYGSGFYLQEWSPDDGTPYVVVTLIYKGLPGGATPPPDIESGIVSAVGQTSKDYSLENDGKGRIVGRKLLWRSYFVSPVGTESDVYAGYQDIYTTSATMDFTYRAVQTRYRYLTLGKPYGPRYSVPDIPLSSSIERVRIATSEGKIYGRQFMTQFDLTPVALNRVLSFQSQQIYGTPYFECEDTVRGELVSSDIGSGPFE